MAEQKPEKTIEMRLAEIEDKLSQMHITEEEMKAYNKVASAMGMGGSGTMGSQAASPQIPITRGISPVHRICIIRWNCTCICPCGPCYECSCGPCSCAGGGGGFGGGFGGFGS
ncbi:MAG: hypothetical protein ACJ746_32560 [Bryobacteraceae bacterium]